MRLPMSREGVEMNDWRENTGHAVIPSEISLETGEPKRVVDPARRANELSGKEWLRNSISVWSDITKSKEERSTKHPASFPEMMVDRLLASFLNKPGKVVLDPFMGTGSTLAAAAKRQHYGIGFELYADFIDIATKRLAPFGDKCQIIGETASKIEEYVKTNSVDMVITSPPYWNIFNRRRTVDGKEIRTYGTNENDLGNINDYDAFLDALINIMRGVHQVLKPKAYCVVNVMDIRIKDRLYPFHSDLYTRLGVIGFQLDDIIIWDRRNEYNNLKTLGYPYKFRLNRVHEYLLIFQKTE
jgi:DNA modification methylase